MGSDPIVSVRQRFSMKTFIMWIEKYAIPLRIVYEGLVVVSPLFLSSEVRGALLPDSVNMSYGRAVAWSAFGMIIILVVVRVLISHITKKSVTKLSDENDGLRDKVEEFQGKISTMEKVVPSALHGILESLRSELDLGNSDRISLYLVQGNGDAQQYFCCERCSTNLEYEKKSCRMRPLAKMFKKIWDEGKLYDDKFPKISNGKKGKREYESYCKKVYNLSADDIQSIKFHGRTYWGTRIDCKGEHLAIIVIASLIKGIGGRDDAEIEKIVKPSCQKLGAVIHAFKDYIPSPDKVKELEEF